MTDITLQFRKLIIKHNGELHTILRDMSEEIERLREALVAYDLAINPPDRPGINMNVWNERLKAATAQGRAALDETK